MNPDPAEYNLLAIEAEFLKSPDQIFDGRAFKLLVGQPGDVWNDDVGADGVWYRQDPMDPVAWEAPKPFSSSFDAVLALKTDEMRITQLKEYVRTDASGPDWQPCGCQIEAFGRLFSTKGYSLGRALLAAILQAKFYKLVVETMRKAGTGDQASG